MFYVSCFFLFFYMHDTRKTRYYNSSSERQWIKKIGNKENTFWHVCTTYTCTWNWEIGTIATYYYHLRINLQLEVSFCKLEILLRVLGTLKCHFVWIFAIILGCNEYGENGGFGMFKKITQIEWIEWWR